MYCGSKLDSACLSSEGCFWHFPVEGGWGQWEVEGESADKTQQPGEVGTGRRLPREIAALLDESLVHFIFQEISGRY